MVDFFGVNLPEAVDRLQLRPNLLTYPGLYPSKLMQLMNGTVDELEVVSSLILEDGQDFDQAFDSLICVSYMAFYWVSRHRLLF